GLVEVDRVDRLDGHELRDLDRVRARLLQGLDLLRLEGDVLVLGELVTLHHLVALHDGAILEAHVLLPEARAAALVQQIEGDRVPRLGRAIELDGYRDESERDGQRSNRPCGHDCLRGCGTAYRVVGLKIRAKFCLVESQSCHRSPAFSKRAITLPRVNSSGSALSSSSQVRGMETGALGLPRGE